MPEGSKRKTKQRKTDQLFWLKQQGENKEGWLDTKKRRTGQIEHQGPIQQQFLQPMVV
jgi:hypothetical protein